MTDITFGQYYPVESKIHSLDPRVKLFATLIYVITLFAFDSVAGAALILFALVFVIYQSKIPFGNMIKGLRAIIVVLIMAGLMNLFLTPGIPLVTWGRVTITDIGLKNAVVMTYRMILLIIGTSILTLSTTPNSLTDGLEKSLNGMKKIGVPVHEIAMMMSIALRFIPILMEETDKIMKAQMARGADFENGGIIQKAKNMIPLLVPLFVSAFRRANDLALAMEARCYNGGDGRTKMKPLMYSKEDKKAYGYIFVYLSLFIAVRIVL